MANPTPITQLPAASQVRNTDVYPGVDTTDTTQSPSGTTKKFTVAQLGTFLAQSISISNKQSCKVATTAELDASYLNGTAGVGATLTNTGALAALEIDGEALSTGDRVLVAYQSNEAHNGIYTVTTVGSNVIAWVLTRATDYDGALSNDINQGDMIGVTLGDVNALTVWFQTAEGPFTVGTSDIIFETLQTIVPAYVQSITPGTSANSKALVLDSSGEIDGVSISDIEDAGTFASNLTVTAGQINTGVGYLTSVTPGSSQASKALVLDASSEIDGTPFSDIIYAAGFAAGITETTTAIDDAAVWVAAQTLDGATADDVIAGMAVAIDNVTTTPGSGTCDIGFRVVDALGNPVIFSGILYISDANGIDNAVSTILASTGAWIDIVGGSSGIYSTNNDGEVELALTGSAGTYYFSLVLQSGAVIRQSFDIDI